MRQASRLFFEVLHEVRKHPDMMFSLKYAKLSGYYKALNERRNINAEPSYHHRQNILGAK